MSTSLENKVALVTGASRGIGREIALGLAKAGCFVYLNCNSNTTKAKAVAETIDSYKKENDAPESAGAAVMPFNVVDEPAVENAVKEITKTKGKIDILVNNAGITQNNLLMRTKTAEWDEVINVNLKGTFLCIRAVTRSMMKAKGGSIINLSSIVGQMGNPGQAAYCASKAGVLGLTKSVAKELASRNIRVNAIAPGFIETDMTDNLGEELKKSMLAQIPLNRFGSPRCIADTVVWLASDASSYVTGQTIAVNGGMFIA